MLTQLSPLLKMGKSYNVRFCSKTAFLLIVRIFLIALAFELQGVYGLLLVMSAQYILTCLSSWALHLMFEFQTKRKVQISFLFISLSGLSLVISYTLSSMEILCISAAFVGLYEGTFWTTFHELREAEFGTSETAVSHWNIFEKCLAALWLVIASFFADFNSEEVCIFLGIMIAILGVLSAERIPVSEPTQFNCVNHVSQNHHIHLALPILEGIATTCWLFYIRLVVLDDYLIDLPLLGTGAAALARVSAMAALSGALLHFLITIRKWKFTLLTSTMLQLPILAILIFIDGGPIQLVCIIAMTLLRSLLLAQSVHTFRVLLAGSYSAHDLRERMKFIGKASGIVLIIPLLDAPTVFLLVVYSMAILTLPVLLFVDSRTVSDTSTMADEIHQDEIHDPN